MSEAPAIPTATTRDEQIVLDGLLDFVRKEVEPLEESLAPVLHDPRRLFDDDGRETVEVDAARRTVRAAAADAGYYAMFCPPSIGGGGLGARLAFLSWEALHLRHGPGERLMYNTISHWASGPSALWTKASGEVAATVRPAVVRGRLQGCFGMSEPDAGSDAWRMKTRAVRQGDSWVLTGSKQWTSFSPRADYILAFAVTDPGMVEARKGGISCFYVPTSTPGFAVESVIRMFGEPGGREGILSLQDVVVPAENLLGDLDRGFDLAMLGATQGRLYNIARSVGLSRWALEQATSYSRQRWASGKPIAEHQAIQFMLADMATGIYAARTMGLDCSARAEAGQDVRREAAMTKVFATNAAFQAFDAAIQVHGAMGFTNELRLHEGWKTTRAIRIADGTDEILRRTIARELLKGNLDF